MSTAPIQLGPGTWALCNPYALDGRVTTHPDSARGFAPMNCYLLTAGDRALLLDAGLSVHEQALLDQLGALLEPGMELSVFPLRQGEFNSVCNARPIAERFGIATMYGLLTEATQWADFRPQYSPFGTPSGSGALAATRCDVVDDEVSVDPRGPRRRLDAIRPALRLLPTHWVYDPDTRTMFTSDCFTHVWRPDERGPWVLASGDADETTAEQVRDYLVGTRFWWLPDADASPIRAAIEETFERYDVETIAPGYGCVLQGADVVARHCELLLEALALADAHAGRGVAR